MFRRLKWLEHQLQCVDHFKGKQEKPIDLMDFDGFPLFSLYVDWRIDVSSLSVLTVLMSICGSLVSTEATICASPPCALSAGTNIPYVNLQVKKKLVSLI